MGFEVTGIFGILVLILDVFAILKTVQSSAETGKKAVWIVIILLLPFIGVILWWFMGPKE